MVSRLSQKMHPGHSFQYKTNGFLAFLPFWAHLGLVMHSGHLLITENASRAQFSLQNQWFSCILAILDKSGTSDWEWSLANHRKWLQGTVFITKPMVFEHLGRGAGREGTVKLLYYSLLGCEMFAYKTNGFLTFDENCRKHGNPEGTVKLLY